MQSEGVGRGGGMGDYWSSSQSIERGKSIVILLRDRTSAPTMPSSDAPAASDIRGRKSTTTGRTASRATPPRRGCAVQSIIGLRQVQVARYVPAYFKERRSKLRSLGQSDRVPPASGYVDSFGSPLQRR